MNMIKMHLKENEEIEVNNYDVDFLETLVYEWVRRWIYFKNSRLTNAILRSTAHKFKAILDLQSFSATKEWLQKFRKTYNLKGVDTEQLSDISYKCSKSTLPVDIFNELLPKWASLDPKSVGTQNATSDTTGVKMLVSDSGTSKVNQVIDIRDGGPDVEIIDFNHEQKEYMNVHNLPPREDETKSMNNQSPASEITFGTNDANITELLDIEDELPVCTIFGRKTVQNVANIISSNEKSDVDRFQPMIVCTDPRNPNFNAIDKSTNKHTFFNKPEVEKMKDLINGKVIDTDSNTSIQNEYIDQYLKELVRVPENDTVIYTRSLNPLLKSTPETEKNRTPILKPISMAKLTIRKIEPKNPQNLKQSSPSDVSLEAIDTESLDANKLEQSLTKPNRKRKMKQNFTQLPENINLETVTLDQEPTVKKVTMDPKPSPLPVESLKTLPAETINQTPTVVQQAWDPAFSPIVTTSNFPGETILDTQSSLVAPGRIMYTFQMSAPNQNQLAMPYISPMTTNLQANQFGQPPIVLHFHSPMTMQTPEMFPSSEMSSAVMNITQTPSISQTSFIPSIDLTQQTTSTNFTNNFIQNQFMPSTTTYVQQSLSTPTMSTTLMQQPSTLGVKASNSTLTITPTAQVQNSTLTTTPPAQVPNCMPTKIKSTKTKRSKAPASTISQLVTSTTTSLTSNSALSTPTACLPNFVSTKITPITTTLNQPPVSTKTPTITSSTLNSSLTRPTPGTACLPNFISTKIIPTTPKLIQPAVSTKSRTITSTITSLTSNSPLTTPTAYLPNFISTNITPTTPTLIQPRVYTKSRTTTSTITSLTSNSALTTPSACLPNLVSTKITPITTTLNQPPVSTKTPTITSSSLNSSLTRTTPTAYLPNFISTNITPTTPTLIQPAVSPRTPTIASPSTINSSLTRATPRAYLKNVVPNKIISTTTTRIQPIVSTKTPTVTSTPLTSTSIQNLPITINSITPKTKTTTPMEVTITKKSKLTTTNAPLNKGTRFAQRAPLKTPEEVVKCIKLMEDFAMMNENFRLIGFLERLEKQTFVNKTK